MSIVEKNKNYEIDITGMTHEGQGVGRIDGLAVFTDGVIEGERAQIRIIKLNKTYAVGKLISIINPSPARIEPFCSEYKRCGGCSLQHMDYGAQLAFKTKLVRDNLERLGGLKDVLVHDTLGMSNPLNYRNKAQYPVAVSGENIVTGFYAARSHDVIDSEECGIQDTVSNSIRMIVRQFIIDKRIPVYNEATGKGLIRHIVTRVGFHTGEVMVVLVVNGGALPGGAAEELVKRLTGADLTQGWGSKTDAAVSGGIINAPKTQDKPDSSNTPAKPESPDTTVIDAANTAEANIVHGTRSPAVKSIYLNINKERTNVILGTENILLYGSETITDSIGKYSFMISPHSFFQVNPVQTEVLYSKALEYAGLTGSETVFDLYCGIGTISLFLSDKARKVYGVEVVEAAIDDARKNASLNGIKNTEFIAGEAEKVVPELYSRGVRADVVVLDPPRKGCEESLLSLLAEMQPERIVYVSCNPATLARDLKHLDSRSYKAVEAQPVDMFPWTGHVETVVLMSRQDK